MLASWVHSLRQGRTILNEEQKQILDVMGFAWDIDEINASKRQNMALEVCLIVILLSLSYNFTNFSLTLRQMNRSAFKMLKVIILAKVGVRVCPAVKNHWKIKNKQIVCNAYCSLPLQHASYLICLYINTQYFLVPYVIVGYVIMGFLHC